MILADHLIFALQRRRPKNNSEELAPPYRTIRRRHHRRRGTIRGGAWRVNECSGLEVLTTVKKHLCGLLRTFRNLRPGTEDATVATALIDHIEQLTLSDLGIMAEVAAEISRQASTEVHAEQGSQAGAQEATSA
jgi:hypothetical protein